MIGYTQHIFKKYNDGEIQKFFHFEKRGDLHYAHIKNHTKIIQYIIKIY